MNELAIRAYHAATALGRRIPTAEASTSPGIDMYSVGHEANGAVFFVTADTSSLIGCGYALNFAKAAKYSSQYDYVLGGFDAMVLDGNSTALIAYNADPTGIANVHGPAPSASVALNHQSALISAVRGIFAHAKISVSSHSDEEEGWTRPLIEVDTGITDPDALNALEYRFYQHVENHETLKVALDTTTVLFE